MGESKPLASPEIITFGCRLNTYESEVMRGHAISAGMTNAVIINSCAVTKEAERQARQAVRRAKRENPDARIIVTGCAAQTNPDQFTKMPEVDQVLGNMEKLEPTAFDLNNTERVQVNDIMSAEETAGHLIEGFDGRARAFLQIQNGCNHRCTFCIIPYGRGNSRSVPLGAIVDQARSLTRNGYKEFVLTGVDITAYGEDLPGQPTLGQMCRRLLAAVPEIERLRLSSLDPVEVDDDLWRLIEKEPRLMPHLHISLQAGDDMVLKRMKRRHLRADVYAFVEKARRLRPDVVFGADIIAGFPTETDEMAANSLRLVEECDIAYMHVFPYSARPGTPAAKMPQVPGDLRKIRAAALREAGDRNLARFLNTLVGTEQQVLVENETTGRTTHYAPVEFAFTSTGGAIIPVIISGTDGKKLYARPRVEANVA
ncbi:MAG: tRNA (N(6)-L-threonylcarbamoyladenosine(37)-C(2))-methylthiotransferase MtaB [Sneathiella sp.]|jgi:threonylcarbamoyladenosine tRNA methylthiotransferase MtaB|uniref:tRNA (N(6)-L-threonylcarbamoyladenosine(37)-C(2))- methylthiotransferase MtaB n=1 Tax=Sneathiella sp. TaxID=1964365 RepID=UPI000C677B8D|nr:tRNA (N(6)-L-threonylcarbamoyladenosine(37)-C(2))-methylthiotransferase MtaB [Sneathiella sp.]MAL78976.1 tRNA (N(6)-L-threonylcarbamoyladenosine(37)-C(2))-methylthiotransferase MtaB [Sneathiella sp.]